MFDSIFILLGLLFAKHWYIDFVNQTNEEVTGKGIYGNAHGVMHSIKHGVATAIVFGLFTQDFAYSVIIGFIDFVLHYHIDWAKMNINKRYNYTIDMPQFWAWLGADQLAHSFTYLLLVWLAI
jgi:uncharacterized membrane protein YphA (DoxX/SURF4 family)